MARYQRRPNFHLDVSTKIEVAGFPTDLKAGLVKKVKQYFSKFGRVKSVRKSRGKNNSLAEVTFTTSASVVKVLHHGNNHCMPLPRGFCNLHVKHFMKPETYRKIKKGLEARRKLKVRLPPANTSTNVMKKPETELNPSNSSQLFVSNYSMGKPSELMDKILKRYFTRYGNILRIYRPPEFHGKCAIITYEQASAVTKAMRVRIHRLHINRFGAKNTLKVKVWEDDGSFVEPPDDDDDAALSSQATAEASQEENKTQDPFKIHHKVRTIFCLGFPKDVYRSKMTNILSRYFAAYGEVVSVKFPEKLNDLVALVTFRNIASMDGVMKYVNRHRVPLTQGGNYCSLYVDVFTSMICYASPSMLDYRSCVTCVCVSEQIAKLTEILSLVRSEIVSRDYCLKRTGGTLERYFPESCCVPFGPSVNNFGYRACIYDLFFKPGKIYLENVGPYFAPDEENDAVPNTDITETAENGAMPNTDITETAENVANDTSNISMKEEKTSVPNQENNVDASTDNATTIPNQENKADASTNNATTIPIAENSTSAVNIDTVDMQNNGTENAQDNVAPIVEHKIDSDFDLMMKLKSVLAENGFIIYEERSCQEYITFYAKRFCL